MIIASSLSGTGILIACKRLLAPLWAHPCPLPSEGDQINKSVNLLDSAFQSKLCGVAVCFSTCSSHIPSDRIHWSSSHCIPFTSCSVFQNSQSYVNGYLMGNGASNELVHSNKGSTSVVIGTPSRHFIQMTALRFQPESRLPYSLEQLGSSTIHLNH